MLFECEFDCGVDDEKFYGEGEKVKCGQVQVKIIGELCDFVVVRVGVVFQFWYECVEWCCFCLCECVNEDVVYLIIVIQKVCSNGDICDDFVVWDCGVGVNRW